MSAAHAPSLYAATADAGLAFPPLTESTRADVAIVGGGYTGLSAALHLAEAGVDVALVEAERVGWGASGRNGGQLHSGQRRDQDWLEEHLGKQAAHRLWTLAEEAKATTLGLIEKHAIACEWRAGLIEAVHRERLVAGEIAYVDKLRADYGYDKVAWLDRAALSEAIGTDVYFGGRRDSTAGHLDPLKFAQGLARAAAKAGARIFEGTRAQKLVGTRVETTGGAISADIVILAGNGYLAGIEPQVEARVMPIDNYILATGPIGAGQPAGLIPGGEAVSDTRFVVYYFRPSADGRLVFGGGETYGNHGHSDVAAMVRKHLARIYPQLADTPVAYAWGGTLAITLPRMPFIRRVRPGVYAAAGYSGQGVAIGALRRQGAGRGDRRRSGQARHLRRPAHRPIPRRQALALPGAGGRHDLVSPPRRGVSRLSAPRMILFEYPNIVAIAEFPAFR